MYWQALNAAAAVDDNKQKIVDAGALAHYVKLLSPEREPTLQTQAAHGLWTLAFSCTDSIVKQQGCLDGLYFIDSLLSPVHTSNSVPATLSNATS